MLVGLSGCALFESETGVDYVGIYDSEVQACAAIAMGGALRDDPTTASTIWVRNVEASLVSSSSDHHDLEYSITGETHVRAGGLKIYDWSCTVDVSYESRTLEATLTRFELADD